MATSSSRFDLEMQAVLDGLRHEVRDRNWLESFGKRASELNGLLAHFRETAEAIAADRDLSPSGREKRLERLRTDTVARVRTIRQQDLSGYRTHIEQLSRSPKKETTPADAFVSALRTFELRSYLMQMDPVERQAHYQALAETGANDELMLAVESAPFPMIDREVLQEGQQRRQSRLNPEASAQIRDLSTLQESLASLLGTAEAEIQAVSSPDDPLQQVRETGQPLADGQPQPSGRTA
jgi:hypothetical protein